MAVKPIITVPNLILKTKTEKIKQIDKDVLIRRVLDLQLLK
jgi:peptide deformylase